MELIDFDSDINVVTTTDCRLPRAWLVMFERRSEEAGYLPNS
jgi:hypothetical protein